jgi:hypothetical protein
MPRLLISLGLGLVLLSGQALGYIQSAFLGGWPGACENNICYDDGQPLSDPPSAIHEQVLEHQLVSSTCPTDLIYLVIRYPANTGSSPLDTRLSREMGVRFDSAKKWAQTLICNDFFGCEGECRPIGLEIKHYVHQSGPGYLSAFRVERFNGNYRQDKNLPGTVKYSFHNYRLSDGQDLILTDIFPEPEKSVPEFWSNAERSLKRAGNCELNKFTISGHRISRTGLAPDDLLLSKLGATVALEGQGACRSQAVDFPVSEMIRLGAAPDLWGR